MDTDRHRSGSPRALGRGEDEAVPATRRGTHTAYHEADDGRQIKKTPQLGRLGSPCGCESSAGVAWIPSLPPFLPCCWFPPPS
jgi:hypothetical protein